MIGLGLCLYISLMTSSLKADACVEQPTRTVGLIFLTTSTRDLVLTPSHSSAGSASASVNDHVVHNLVGDTKTCRSSTVDDDLRIQQVSLANLESRSHRSHDNSTSSLDVVVETWQFFSIFLQNWSSSGDPEIFKVQNGTWESLFDGLNELVHELVVFLSSNSLESVSHVKIII
ncbi:hypothetical protein OGATHE_006041 [Ogataea polymorpha]|uniref:Uncharacterized protein n=1 Tax=Ogataea polymorpha TaxID=460523 RepID=A0A9P8NSL6_9ASCO|nr:hypothetical protein OGATHE_006041 [Ogataea polymorpha]